METKVYYVISTGGRHYLTNFGGRREEIVVGFQGSLATAARFSTVREALTFITQGTWAQNVRDRQKAYSLTYLSDELKLVRVEEIPGTEGRLLLEETEKAPVGTTVKYAIHFPASTTQFGERFFRPGGMYRTINPLSDATLYDTQANAIQAIVKDLAGCFDATVVRVAVAAGKPSTLEIVLE